MNGLDKQYTDLLQDILDNGVKKGDRTGTGTISVFGRQIRHKMSEGFPLLTSKKMPFKTITTELLWFLRGDTNIKYLVDNNCHIWDGDAYQRYKTTYDIESREGSYGLEELHMLSDLTKEEFINKIKTDDEFAKKWGELGPIYGKQWRNWEILKRDNTASWKEKIDQIQNLINDLKTNPYSRRLMVNAWNVGELDQMVLPPCHYSFQVYTRELSNEEVAFEANKRGFNLKGMTVMGKLLIDPKEVKEYNLPTRAISLMWNQRSVDTFLGLPFNIASYGLLLEIIAKEVNMVPDELIGNLGDVHLYSNHIEQAKEQIGREYTHEEMVEIYYLLENKKDREGLWTWETRFEDNNISKRTREPYPLPKLGMDYREGEYNKNLTDFVPDDFYLIDYQSHPTIKAPLSN
jgi:thymidylate synthase